MAATAEHPNVAMVRRAYEAMATGDISWMQANSSPDIVFTQLGRNPIAGRFEGQEKMFGHFGEFVGITGGDFKFTIGDVLVNDERAVVLMHLSAGRPDGRRLDLDEVHVFDFGADGKVAALKAIPEDAYALDEFFS
jgi:uncharacterized protein